MNQNQIPANIMMSNMMNNNSPSISSMGGGTPISQLRKDVVIAKSQKVESDKYDDYTTESDRNSHIKNLVEDINNYRKIYTETKALEDLEKYNTSLQMRNKYLANKRDR